MTSISSYYPTVYTLDALPKGFVYDEDKKTIMSPVTLREATLIEGGEVVNGHGVRYEHITHFVTDHIQMAISGYRECKKHERIAFQVAQNGEITFAQLKKGYRQIELGCDRHCIIQNSTLCGLISIIIAIIILSASIPIICMI